MPYAYTLREIEKNSGKIIPVNSTVLCSNDTLTEWIVEGLAIEQAGDEHISPDGVKVFTPENKVKRERKKKKETTQEEE